MKLAPNNLLVSCGVNVSFVAKAHISTAWRQGSLVAPLLLFWHRG